MTIRVRPLPQPPLRPSTTDGLCGHWALAYVTNRSLPRIIADLGHQRPLALREIVRELTHAGVVPLVVHHETLQRDGRDLWFAHGEDQFLAICCELDLTDECSIGHAVVLHGLRLHDPADPMNSRRVSASALGNFACAIICSRGRP